MARYPPGNSQMRSISVSPEQVHSSRLTNSGQPLYTLLASPAGVMLSESRTS